MYNIIFRNVCYKLLIFIILSCSWIPRSNVVAQIVDQLQEKTGAIAEEYLKDFEKVVADVS